MATTHKAVELARYIQEELKARALLLSTPLVVGDLTFDASGNPMIQYGAGGAGTQSAWIKVMPVDAWGYDIIGHAQTVYNPLKIKIAFEAAAAGAWPLVTMENQAPVLGVCLGKGCITEFWLDTNGTAAQDSTFNTAAKQKATFNLQSQYPYAGQ
jgi:hypothetical protein